MSKWLERQTDNDLIGGLFDPVDIAEALSPEHYPVTLVHVPKKQLVVWAYELGLDQEAKDRFQRTTKKVAESVAKKDASGVFTGTGIGWALFQPLTVNRRNTRQGTPGNVYSVLDGGTRLKMLNLLEVPDNALVPCLVYDFDIGFVNEALVYTYLNSDRQGLSAVDIFVSARTARHPEVVNINQLMMSAGGVEIGPRTNQLKSVQAVTDLYAFDKAKDDHGRLLRETFLALKAAGWLPPDTKPTPNPIVGGVGLIVRYAMEHPDNYTTIYKKLVEVTSKTTWEEVAIAAKPMQGKMTAISRDRVKLVAAELGARMNKGRGERIDPDVVNGWLLANPKPTPVKA